MRERFGLVVNVEDYSKIVRLIQDGKATLISKQRNERILVKLIIDKHNVYIVYDNIKRAVITALTKEMAYDRSINQQVSITDGSAEGRENGKTQ